MEEPPRLASPGNPVVVGNYRVSIRQEDGAYETPTFPYPSVGGPDQPAADTAPGAQVNLKPGDVWHISVSRTTLTQSMSPRCINSRETGTPYSLLTRAFNLR